MRRAASAVGLAHDEIEAAEAVLTADPMSQRAQEDIPALGLGADKHSPGTWQVEADAEMVGRHPYHNWRYVTATHRGKTLTIYKMMDSERMVYDARLIAAALRIKSLLKLAYRYLAVMAAENIQTVLLPQTVMSRIDELMAQIESPIPPWQEERKP